MLDIKRGCTVKFIARAFKKTDNYSHEIILNYSDLEPTKKFG